MCGRDAQIVRLPNGGSEEVIATIRGFRDVFSTFALEESDTSTTLLLGRQPCREPDTEGRGYSDPQRRYDHVISIGQAVPRISASEWSVVPT